jgi:hypothetical protein
MTTTTRGIAATTPDPPAENRADVTARHLFEAEVALHIAHQSHVDAWIAAAGDKLHQAVVEHLAAIGGQDGSSHERPDLASFRGHLCRQSTALAARHRHRRGVAR